MALRMKPGSKTVGNLAKGRRILLRAGDQIDEAKVVATTPFAASPRRNRRSSPGRLHAGARDASDEATVLLGNVAAASHGETQPLEALGHGDGAKPFQTFKLSRPNLTYLQAAASLEGTAALEIRVNGELWKETPSFFGRGAGEQLLHSAPERQWRDLRRLR